MRACSKSSVENLSEEHCVLNWVILIVHPQGKERAEDKSTNRVCIRFKRHLANLCGAAMSKQKSKTLMDVLNAINSSPRITDRRRQQLEESVRWLSAKLGKDGHLVRGDEIDAM